MAEGIRIRHSRTCKSRSGKSCNCTPSHEAWAWSKRDEKKLRKTFTGRGALAAAKGWRSDATSAIRKGTLKAPTAITLKEAAEEWLRLAEAGVVRDRSGNSFKPSTIRTYEQRLRLRVLPELGDLRLTDITRNDLQDLVDELVAYGMSASSVGVTLLPVRALYRRAMKRGEVALNPTADLEMPAVRGGRDRIVSPEQAEKLIVALPAEDRALWATAMYAGLRRGELQALRWRDVDPIAGKIRGADRRDPSRLPRRAPTPHWRRGAGVWTEPGLGVYPEYRH